jgi:hypothetical protein
VLGTTNPATSADNAIASFISASIIKSFVKGDKTPGLPRLRQAVSCSGKHPSLSEEVEMLSASIRLRWTVTAMPTTSASPAAGTEARELLLLTGRRAASNHFHGRQVDVARHAVRPQPSGRL